MDKLITLEESRILKQLNFNGEGTWFYIENGSINNGFRAITNKGLNENQYLAVTYSDLYWWIKEYYSLNMIYSRNREIYDQKYTLSIEGISNIIIWEDNNIYNRIEGAKILVRCALHLLGLDQFFIRIK